MKKKLVMKKWVEVVLSIIAIFCFMVCGSECDDLLLFAVSHIICGVILLLIGLMFMSFGRERD